MRLAVCAGPDSVSTSECRVSASAALFNSAASESLTTPLAFSKSSNCCIPAAPETLLRLLASDVVRIPFLTRRSTRVGLSAAPAPTLAPLFVGAALAAALVGSAAVVAAGVSSVDRHWNQETRDREQAQYR